MADQHDANLNLNIEYSSVDKAGRSLNDFQGSASRAATSTREYGSNADRMSRSLEEMVRQQQQMNQLLAQTRDAQQQASDAVQAHRRHVVELGAAVVGLVTGYEVAKVAVRGFTDVIKLTFTAMKDLGELVATKNPFTMMAQQAQVAAQAAQAIRDISLSTGASFGSVAGFQNLGGQLGISGQEQTSLLARMQTNISGISESTRVAREQMEQLGVHARTAEQATRETLIALDKYRDGFEKLQIARNIFGENVDPRLLSREATTAILPITQQQQFAQEQQATVAALRGVLDEMRRRNLAETGRDPREFFGLAERGQRGFAPGNPLSGIPGSQYLWRWWNESLSQSPWDETTPYGARYGIGEERGERALGDIFRRGQFGQGIGELGQNWWYNARNLGSQLTGGLIAPPETPAGVGENRPEVPPDIETQRVAEQFLRMVDPANRAFVQLERETRLAADLLAKHAITTEESADAIRILTNRASRLADPIGTLLTTQEREQAIGGLPLDQRGRARALLPYQNLAELRGRPITSEQEARIGGDYQIGLVNKGQDLLDAQDRQAAEARDLAKAYGENAGAVARVQAQYQAHEEVLHDQISATQEAAEVTRLLTKSFEDLQIGAAKYVRDTAQEAAAAGRVAGAAGGGPRAVQAAQEEEEVRKRFQDLRASAGAGDMSAIDAQEREALDNVRKKRQEDQTRAQREFEFNQRQRTGIITGTAGGVGGLPFPTLQNPHGQPLTWRQDFPAGGPSGVSADFYGPGSPYGRGPGSPATTTPIRAVPPSSGQAQTAMRQYQAQAAGMTNVPPGMEGQNAQLLAGAAASEDLYSAERRNRQTEQDLELRKQLVAAARESAAAEKEVGDAIRVQQQFSKAEIDASLSGNKQIIGLVQQRKSEAMALAAQERELAGQEAQARIGRQQGDRISDTQSLTGAFAAGGQNAYEVQKRALEEINQLKAAGVTIDQQAVALAQQHARATIQAEDQLKVMQDATSQLRSDISGTLDSALHAATGLIGNPGGARGALQGIARSVADMGLKTFVTNPLNALTGNIIEGRGATFNQGSSGMSAMSAMSGILNKGLGALFGKDGGLFGGGVSQEATDVASMWGGGGEADVQAGLNSGSGGSFGPFGNWVSSIFAMGGMVGMPGPSRRVPAHLFLHAPRAASGMLLPDEVPIIAHTGERVLNRAETRNYNTNSGAAGGGPIIHAPINVYTADVGGFRASGTQIQAAHQAQIERGFRNN